jgi:hypothetical protein
MSSYIIQGDTLTAIADAIREKTETSGAMTAADMAGSIASIVTVGDGISGSGYTKVSSGSFTLESSTRGTTVNHELGEVPKMIIVYFDDAESATLYSAFNDYKLSLILAKTYVDANGTTYTINHTRGSRGTDETLSLGGVVYNTFETGEYPWQATPAGIQYVTAKKFEIDVQNGAGWDYYLVGGVKYHWIVLA